MYYSTKPEGIDWIVYDHRSCGYEPYTPGTGVEAQIEASFQSNLKHNFPESCYPVYDNRYFNHSSLSLINKVNNVANWVETYALRCYFEDNEERKEEEIYHLEEYLWSHSGRYSFPRNLKRWNHAIQENDMCHAEKSRNFNLRMEPLK